MVSLVSTNRAPITAIIKSKHKNVYNNGDWDWDWDFQERYPTGYPRSILPRDLIFNNTLPRLNLDDILRYKSVSREWRVVLQSDHFMNGYINHSGMISNHRMSLLQRDMYIPEPSGGLKFEFLTWDCNVSIKSTILPMDDRALFVGSVNGLICVLSKDPDVFSVWNPVTRRIREIQSDKIGDGAPRMRAYGFGKSDDDYLITACYNNSEFLVFSFNSNSWATIVPNIEDFDGNEMYSRGFLAGKHLYWAWDEGEYMKGLVTFNMLTRELTCIDIPVWINSSFTIQNMWAADDDTVFVYCRFYTKTSDLWRLVGNRVEFVFSVLEENRDGLLLGPIKENKILVHKMDFTHNKRGCIRVYDLIKEKFIGKVFYIDTKIGDYWTAIPYLPRLEEI